MSDHRARSRARCAPDSPAIGLTGAVRVRHSRTESVRRFRAPDSCTWPAGPIRAP